MLSGLLLSIILCHCCTVVYTYMTYVLATRYLYSSTSSHHFIYVSMFRDRVLFPPFSLGQTRASSHRFLRAISVLKELPEWPESLELVPEIRIQHFHVTERRPHVTLFSHLHLSTLNSRLLSKTDHHSHNKPKTARYRNIQQCKRMLTARYQNCIQEQTNQE
jgi:hypothetical protein